MNLFKNFVFNFFVLLFCVTVSHILGILLLGFHATGSNTQPSHCQSNALTSRSITLQGMKKVAKIESKFVYKFLISTRPFEATFIFLCFDTQLPQSHTYYHALVCKVYVVSANFDCGQIMTWILWPGSPMFHRCVHVEQYTWMIT